MLPIGFPLADLLTDHNDEHSKENITLNCVHWGMLVTSLEV